MTELGLVSTLKALPEAERRLFNMRSVRRINHLYGHEEIDRLANGIEGINRDEARAEAVTAEYRDLFGKDHFWLELQRNGIDIQGRSGQPVLAAAGGEVVYSGSGLIGYGQLIIIKHNESYLSAYGYTASLLVKEGQSINQGQRIATMGEGPERKPRLHFEIRRNGEPVNPRQYLPAR